MPTVIKRGNLINLGTILVGECKKCESLIEALRGEFPDKSYTGYEPHIICPVCRSAILLTRFQAKGS